MKFYKSLSLLFILSNKAFFGSAQTCSSSHSFSLKLENVCNYEALKQAYAEYLGAPENQIASSAGGSSCTADDIDILLDGVNVHRLCKRATDKNGKIKFDEIVHQTDSKFLESYYRGNTYWNEEVQTNYDLDDPNGPTTNVLKEDILQIPLYYELAENKRVEYPKDHDNFKPNNCKLNTVMCCWSLDRQANDNNGNCAKPYDQNCVDKDPADNTDICGVHLDRGNSSNNLNTDGFLALNGDDEDGEGDTHCHGFAFSNHENDHETRYKGNNLFYISMYDHLYQRGYARNIPGAPMCGCVEQMPVVTRSDCTQVDVTEVYTFDYDPLSGFSVTVSDVKIDFNACQGLNNKNNDLSAYVARLETEGKVTLEQKNELKKHLVENGNCPTAIQRNMASKGIVRGFPDNSFELQYEFPSTDTNQFVHGLCVLGAIDAAAFSDTDPTLYYTPVPDFGDGDLLWGDREYTVANVNGAAMCEGGIYLKPSRHKTIPRYSDITIGANPVDQDVSICAIVTTDSRTGKWNEKLPPLKFTASNEFNWGKDNIQGKFISYCLTLPQPDTPSPTAAPTRTPGSVAGISYTFPKVDTSQFVHGLCVMGDIASVSATSTDANLQYTIGGEFKTDTTLWDDRNYVAKDVSGIQDCEGGTYLEPTRHKSIARNTVITLQAEFTGALVVCALIVTDSRTGLWDQTLPSQGFTASSKTWKFTNGSVTGNMRTYCKSM